jgi:threonine dehydrogenase-like Zn-dependent dehydrogenase
MRALVWNGINSLKVERIPDPQIVADTDVIVQVRASTTCGSDLHLIDGLIPTMRPGDVLGHEFMGEVVETGRAVRSLRKGQRVTVPSFIVCGGCWYCSKGLFSLCDNTNPHAALQQGALSVPTAGIYGYSHAFGGYAGAHANFVRVPFADNDCFVLPDSISDEQAVFLSDACPTGFMGADLCDVEPGDVVAVWGCGGVGLMAQQSAFILGAERVIAIDRFPERLALAERLGCETLNYLEVPDIVEALVEMTGGRGPDACIDAVGMEAGGFGPGYMVDRLKQATRMQTDVGIALRQAVQAVRKGGRICVLGVYGMMDHFPMGVLMNKGVTLRAAQQHGQAYVPRLIDYTEQGALTPELLATHVFALDDAARGYKMFKHKEDGCIRAVFRP